jgi:N-methylhydantoinase A
MIDIHVIGAGGGSIAWMDDAGALKVGPRSAGAVPGPVAYSKGGTEPTITDAMVCLHRLNPVSLLEGRMPVNEAGARAVIQERVAQPLGLGLEAAAEGVIRIANANMSRAIRAVSTERGYDLSQFALFAFGGAGPLHATDIAAECGIPTVVVPQEPGTMCARGMLLTDVSFDFVRSEIAELAAATWRRVAELFAGMEKEAAAWLDRERVASADRTFRRHVDARYQGQNFEVIVQLEGAAAESMEAFTQAFHRAHRQEYGYELQDRAIEAVNCRLQAVGKVTKAPLQEVKATGTLAQSQVGQRSIYHGAAHGWVDTPVYARARFAAGTEVPGPAVIEEMSSTTLLNPGQVARVDRIGNLVIAIKA